MLSSAAVKDLLITYSAFDAAGLRPGALLITSLDNNNGDFLPAQNVGHLALLDFYLCSPCFPHLDALSH